MRLILLIFLLCSCSARKADSSYAQIDVVCPKEGLLSAPMTFRCECSDPNSTRKGGFMSILGGAVGYAVETLTD